MRATVRGFGPQIYTDFTPDQTTTILQACSPTISKELSPIAITPSPCSARWPFTVTAPRATWSQPYRASSMFAVTDWPASMIDAIDVDILVHSDGTITAIVRRDQPQLPAPLVFRKRLLLVSRFEIQRVRQDPDLQQMDRLVLRRILLAMPDAGAGTSCAARHPAE